MTASREHPGAGVIVAIPTFNRARTLERAARSALAQEHSEITVLIADNASTDETPRVCRALAASDPRVLIQRHSRNLGLTANFNWLMCHALEYHREADAYFMFLGDDDWLEPNYVRMCVQALAPDRSMAAGRTLCHVPGEHPWFAPDVHLNADDALDRVARLCRDVLPTGVFSGLMRLDTLARLPPQRNVIGNDWLLFANIAYLGKVATIEEATINRSAGGASTSHRQLAQTLGVSRLQAFKPLLTVATYFLLECFRRSPVFAALPVWRRMRLSAVVLVSLAERKIGSMRKQFSTRALAGFEATLRRVRTGLIGR